MIASAVVSAAQVEARLQALGFEPTKERTATGVFWCRKSDGRHLLIPDSVQGFYPDWMLADLEKEIGKINAWGQFKPTH
jgi:hypothetical protein